MEGLASESRTPSLAGWSIVASALLFFPLELPPIRESPRLSPHSGRMCICLGHPSPPSRAYGRYPASPFALAYGIILPVRVRRSASHLIVPRAGLVGIPELCGFCIASSFCGSVGKDECLHHSWKKGR